MALTVEDGTGLTDAESYISEVEADAYFEKRGVTAWDSVADKEALLRKATDYLQGRYAGQWDGYRSTATQALDWPRFGVPIKDRLYANGSIFHDSDKIPMAVKHACALLAFRASTSNLLEDQGQRVVNVTVGPISTTYDSASSPTKRYFEIDAMLAPYLKTAGGIKMVRI